jgi:hypothetical protein
MYFTYADIEKYITINGIPTISKEIYNHLQTIQSSIVPPSYPTAPPPPFQSLESNPSNKSIRGNMGGCDGNSSSKYANKTGNNSLWKEKKKNFNSSSQAAANRYSPTNSRLPENSSSSFKTPEERSSHPATNSWIDEKKKNTVAFVATKIEKKSGIEQSMNEIRVLLNKMTPKNYESQREKLFELFRSSQERNEGEHQFSVACEGKMKESHEQIVGGEEDQSTVVEAHTLAQFIFNLASSNTFQTDLYARLYTDIIHQTDIKTKTLFQDILHDFLSHFKQSIRTDAVEYADPDIDYDKYCKYVKENDRKKAITRFAFHLYKNNVVPEMIIIELIEYFLFVLTENIDQENKTNETEEMVEIVYIFITMGNECGLNSSLLQHTQWDSIMNGIIGISQMKVKEHKSFSSRALFKIQSLLKK